MSSLLLCDNSSKDDIFQIEKILKSSCYYVFFHDGYSKLIAQGKRPLIRRLLKYKPENNENHQETSA